jgi:hypothetical protein
MSISMKSINEFIKMYDKQDVLTVRECTQENPADRYVFGDTGIFGFQVKHLRGEDIYVYTCGSVKSAAECVNDILFDARVGGSLAPDNFVEGKYDD